MRSNFNTQCFGRIVFCFWFASIPYFSSQNAFAGPIRDMIKNRIEKRMEEKPEPSTDADVNTKFKPGDYTVSMNYSGIKRYYMVHVPRQYDGKSPSPLLLALHGGGGDMGIQATDEFYKLISKSDKEGFIAVFPNGFSPFNSGKLATWNAGKCCAAARDKNIDDVGFIKKVVSNVSAQAAIDPNKIFAIGMSNGGMLSYRLACELATTFRAIASVAGTDNTVQCSPKAPISVLHIHAKNDDKVLFNGGAGASFRDESKVTDFVSVPETISKWVKLNGCDPTPNRVLQNPQAYCDKYSKCQNNTEVQLCVTEKGGHSWPGGKKPRGNGGDPSKAISANDVIWDFFKSK